MIGDVGDLDISSDALFYADYMYGHVREYDLDGNLTAVGWASRERVLESFIRCDM